MPALFLYEPRMLLRAVVTQLVQEEYSSFQAYQTLSQLTDDLSAKTSSNKLLLVGIAGAGGELTDLLRFIRNNKSLKILAWVPAEYPWLFKLLNSVYVGQVVCEENIATELQPALKELIGIKSVSTGNNGGAKRPRRITLTELEILLQFAAGLSSREMADYRQCSYKTIFSWKHNICEALNIETNAQWLEVLTEIVQLSSMYRVGQNDVTL